MKEVAFTASKKKLVTQVRELGHAAVKYGLGKRPIRWTLLAAPFYMGTGIYGFYAAQPYLLKLFGDPHAIGIAGIAAAGIAGTQVAGGFAVPWIRRRFKRRTHVLLASAILTVVALALIGLVQNFYVVVALLLVWAMASAASEPVRQTYLNSLIPSEQRATVLSFDSMVSSAGGVVFQPILGRVADSLGYAISYVVSACIALVGVPFLLLARRENVREDLFSSGEPKDAAPASTRA
jgi:MFS family permease